jgi:Response regulator containing CheY-like receiver domain and AraC-type DNA-binding domain
MNPADDLRRQLEAAYRSLKGQRPRLRFPKPQGLEPVPGEGPFHLRPELFMQRQASTLFRFPSETLELRPGEILVVPPRVNHFETVLSGTKPFLNLVIYADGSALSCHAAEGRPGRRPRVVYPERIEGPSCSQVATWLEAAARLRWENAESEEIVLDLVRSALGMAMLLLDQPAAGAGKDPLAVVRCLRLIHEDLGNPELSVGSLAHALGCNADYLSHLFRTVRGERLTEYVDELRMQRAAELLTRTELSCKEVAWASGFANQSYFIRRFRARWGCSPVAYKRKPRSTP